MMINTTIRCSFPTPTMAAKPNMGIDGMKAADRFAVIIELTVPVTAATPADDREAMYAALFGGA